MYNHFFSSPDKSVYLDTSFILKAVGNFIEDDNGNIVSECQGIVGLLYQYKIDNCFISDVVLGELFNVIERTGFKVYIDKQIINSSGITIDEWKCFSNQEKDSERKKYTTLNLYRDLKSWRKEPRFSSDYKILVENEFQNILDSLPEGIQCISQFCDNDNEIIGKFKTTRKKLNYLDSNDIYSYLICKHNSIDGLLTCDSDYKQIRDSDMSIIVVDNNFRLI